MKVGDVEYSVEFSTHKIAVNYYRHGERMVKEREALRCEIKRGKDRELVSIADVVRYHLDPPNQKLARRYAFLRALKKLERPMRVEIGAQYFKGMRAIPKLELPTPHAMREVSA